MSIIIGEEKEEGCVRRQGFGRTLTELVNLVGRGGMADEEERAKGPGKTGEWRGEEFTMRVVSSPTAGR